MDQDDHHRDGSDMQLHPKLVSMDVEGAVHIWLWSLKTLEPVGRQPLVIIPAGVYPEPPICLQLNPFNNSLQLAVLYPSHARVYLIPIHLSTPVSTPVELRSPTIHDIKSILLADFNAPLGFSFAGCAIHRSNGLLTWTGQGAWTEWRMDGTMIQQKQPSDDTFRDLFMTYAKNSLLTASLDRTHLRLSSWKVSEQSQVVSRYPISFGKKRESTCAIVLHDSCIAWGKSKYS